MELPDGYEAKTDAETLGPLGFDRVKEALEALEYRYFIDSDGDIGGRWDANDFYFFLEGDHHEILTVRGYWWARLPGDRYAEANRIASDWHSKYRWPTVFVWVDEAGKLSPQSKLTMDWTDGVTDAQLKRQISLGVRTGSQFFDHLAEKFPEAKPLSAPGKLRCLRYAGGSRSG
jgi:hypothetical protein